ncbi:MAG TPA: phosphoglycerate kinase [Candidatus Paceibacterota bacterium]
MKSISDFELEGKRVLLRCDLNVPFGEGSIQDDFRIEQSVPTIRYIAEKEGRCIMLAHFGRPTPMFQKEYSLKPLVPRLQELLGKEIKFIGDPIGEGVKKEIEALKPGEVALLENIRFYKGEEENDPVFAKKLAELGDLYVNDAFGACHRAHASIAGITRFLPSAAGLLLQKEVDVLGKVSMHPAKPLVVVVGGTKVGDKASFMKTISKHADSILLGNLIAKEVKEKGIDVSKETELVYATDGVDGDFDLGPETIKIFRGKIAGARTVFWAGPLGRTEEERYEKGSLAIADAIIRSGAFAVAGGGDLAGFLGKHHLREKFAHVSTGGGAMLAFLSGEELPGLKALE